MRIRPILLFILLAIFLAGHTVLAQIAVVTQPVHLRADPSTNNPSLRLLYPQERLQRIPPKESGDFYRVRISQAETGWVWKRNVSLYNRDDWMKHGKWADADDDCQDTVTLMAGA